MLLITGASANAGLAFRTASRTPDTANGGLTGSKVHLDFADPATFDAALDACDAVFLMRPPAILNTRRTLNVFTNAALRRGIQHIVFLSVVGADQHAWVPRTAMSLNSC